ncbi:MAG: hypothetical protein ACF8R7_18495 [Phycisphaerales bacterium JB039]
MIARLLALLGIKPKPRKLVPAFAESWSPTGLRAMKLHLGEVNNLDPDRRWY